MVTTSARRVAAGYLRSGDLVHWEGGIGMVRVEHGGGLRPARILVRRAEKPALLAGLVSRWVAWNVLHTPIHQLPLDELVWRVATAPEREQAAG